MAGTLGGALTADAARRREAAERAASSPSLQEITVRNSVIQALSALPDPRQALRVCEAVERSIREFIAVQARLGF